MSADAAGRIMLIRHAEAPEEGGVGLHGDGTAGEGGLGLRGWQRAGALARWFAPLDGAPLRGLETPVHVFAAAPTAAHPSTRPRDTVAPLAALLGLEVDERFDTDMPLERVADVLRRLGGPVLVCWRHDGLPALANELLQRPGEVPARWPETRHDVAWVLAPGGAGWRFTQLPQRLLAGDLPQGIARRAARATEAAR